MKAMRCFFLALLLLLTAAVQPAFADDCYGLKEQQAEAAVRIHSELMVTALTCQYAPSGENLVDMYVTFGQRHGARLRAAEQALIGYHNNRGAAGVASLDRLRTVLGNEYAERIAVNDPMLYCPRMANMVVGAARWSPQQFEQAIQRAAAAGGSTLPACLVQANNNN